MLRALGRVSTRSLGAVARAGTSPWTSFSAVILDRSLVAPGVGQVAAG